MRIVLASGSPRRKELLGELLKKYNLTYEVIVSNVDEEDIKNTNISPSMLVKELSLIKAQNAFDKIKDDNNQVLVIGGDTIVFFEDKFLGKPKSKEDAVNMLELIQGKVNYVYTGTTAIIKIENDIFCETTYNKSEVYMKKISREEIIEYVSTEEPMDKAGAYAIQGIGNKYIEKYVGDYNSIVGLDTKNIEEILKKYNII